jgi:hypothetical protein
MSTLRVNNITDTSCGSSSLSVPGAAKAWVNFNGTGTVAIRAQLNVSSITDNGVGDYTVNFTNALADANYSVSFGGQGVSASGWWRFLGSGAASVNGFSSSSYRFQTPDVAFNVVDTQIATLCFFR